MVVGVKEIHVGEERILIVERKKVVGGEQKRSELKRRKKGIKTKTRRRERPF